MATSQLLLASPRMPMALPRSVVFARHISKSKLAFYRRMKRKKAAEKAAEAPTTPKDEASTPTTKGKEPATEPIQSTQPKASLSGSRSRKRRERRLRRKAEERLAVQEAADTGAAAEQSDQGEGTSRSAHPTGSSAPAKQPPEVVAIARDIAEALKTSESEEQGRKSRKDAGKDAGKGATKDAFPVSDSPNPAPQAPEAVATPEGVPASDTARPKESASADEGPSLKSVPMNLATRLWTRHIAPHLEKKRSRVPRATMPVMKPAQKPVPEQPPPETIVASDGEASEPPGSTITSEETPEASVRSVTPAPKHLRRPLTIEPIRTFSFSFKSIPFEPVTPLVPQPPIAKLAHGLDRTLYNPGVHWLRDPRTDVFNFSPSLQDLVTPDEFNFAALPEYMTSSRDEQLIALAHESGRKYSGSTSSMTGMLSQIYFAINGRKPLNMGRISRGFPVAKVPDFTPGAKMPASVVLKYHEGRYSIDADKTFDQDDDDPDANILTRLGHVMESFFTTSDSEFQKLLVKNKASFPPQDKKERQAYAYGQTNLLFTRSQLDCESPFLPGNGTFDIKTRAAVAIRQDRLNHANSAGYQIRRSLGYLESFEREYYDLIRSGFLKYQFQARIGQMDGCFVAYHNTRRVFGFEYVPIGQMDEALFGTPEEGDKVFRLCLGYLEQVLEDATKQYPDQSVRLTFVAKSTNNLMVFVSPMEPQPSASRSLPSEYKMLEYLHHNYLDGDIVEEGHVDIQEWVHKNMGVYDDPNAREGLDWSVFSQVLYHDKSEATDKILADVRKAQAELSQLVIPEGVNRRAIRTANWPETADEPLSDHEWDENLPPSRKPFTPVPGKKYRTNVSIMVRQLRDLAKTGWERQEEQDKRIAAAKIIRIAPVEYLVQDAQRRTETVKSDPDAEVSGIEALRADQTSPGASIADGAKGKISSENGGSKSV